MNQIIIYNTSAKIIVGMHHANNRGSKEIPLYSNTIILAQLCITLCLNYVGRVMHDCASILDSIIAKGISLFSRRAVLATLGYFMDKRPLQKQSKKP